MKKKIIFLLLAIVLLFTACGNDGAQGGNDHDDDDKSGSSTIRFTIDGRAGWIEPANGDTGYIYAVMQENTASENDLDQMGITSVDELTMRILVRYVGECTLSDGAYTLTIEKMQMHAEMVCSNPGAATSEFLDFMKQQNIAETEMYEALFGKDYVDAAEVGMENAEYIGAKFSFASKNGKLLYMNTSLADGTPESEMDFYDNGAVKCNKTYDDGKLWRVDEYSEDGAQSKSTRYYDNGNYASVHEYYANGNTKTSTDYYENGKISEVEEYSETGNLIKHTSYYENGSIRSQNEYAENGTQTVEIEYYENGAESSRSEFDEKGQCVKRISYYEDGTTRSLTEYADGIMVLACQYENGIELSRIENGAIVKDCSSANWGQIVEVVEYGADGQKIKSNEYHDMDSPNFYLYCYREYVDGNCVLEVYYNPEGVETGRYEYTN